MGEAPTEFLRELGILPPADLAVDDLAGSSRGTMLVGRSGRDLGGYMSLGDGGGWAPLFADPPIVYDDTQVARLAEGMTDLRLYPPGAMVASVALILLLRDVGLALLSDRELHARRSLELGPDARARWDTTHPAAGRLFRLIGEEPRP